jgi:hypothetical protein
VTAGFNGKTTGGISVMGKKLMVIALAVLTFGFGWTMRSNAGTEVIEPYSAAPTYNYAPPPPRPIVYIPPPVVGVVVAPAFRYYGPRFGFFGARRFYARGAYWRSYHHWR